jgi:hypothetical protein
MSTVLKSKVVLNFKLFLFLKTEDVVYLLFEFSKYFIKLPINFELMVICYCNSMNLF